MNKFNNNFILSTLAYPDYKLFQLLPTYHQRQQRIMK